ncbi:hypothetical protein BKA56DRAFT_656049 [Ilyonectria sp. MPI-CAGE-AT-0026]|nr:hypothetical protein BKA56DRAFT_716163 [Ilyonectria sp. MPI-CAGE-AT-0026]KAH6983633.1 hypothetical protein BKA56DRAFT_656049 [Ilyonectria sp. MPI-CAGE-AT-0026]
MTGAPSRRVGVMGCLHGCFISVSGTSCFPRCIQCVISAYYLRMLEHLQHRLNLYSGGLEYLEYVPGGTQASVVTVNTYDAVALTWTILSSLPAPHNHVGGAIVADRLYVISGRQNFTVADPVYAMDLAASQLALTSKVRIPTVRGGLSFGVIGRRIFSFGGEGNPDPGSKGVLNEADMHDVSSNMWIKLEPMQYPRHGTCAASVDGRIRLGLESCFRTRKTYHFGIPCVV